MQRSVLMRTVEAIVIGYVLLALVTRAREAAGVYTCGCDGDCWCRTPGLSLFRWVFPRRHRNRAVTAWKAAQAT